MGLAVVIEPVQNLGHAFAHRLAGELKRNRFGHASRDMNLAPRGILELGDDRRKRLVIDININRVAVLVPDDGVSFGSPQMSAGSLSQ